MWLAIRASAEALLADDIALATAILKVKIPAMTNLILIEKFDISCLQLPSPKIVFMRQTLGKQNRDF